MLGNRQIRMMKRDISERGTHLFPPARMRHPTTPGYGQILGAVPGDHLRQAGAPEEFGILLTTESNGFLWRETVPDEPSSEGPLCRRNLVPSTPLPLRASTKTLL